MQDFGTKVKKSAKYRDKFLITFNNLSTGELVLVFAVDFTVLFCATCGIQFKRYTICKNGLKNE